MSVNYGWRMNSGTIEGGRGAVKSVDLTPNPGNLPFSLNYDNDCGLWLGVEQEEGGP